MKKRYFGLIACSLCLILALVFASFADFGDFGGDADYGGGGGGYDYGGGGGNYGGGWDDDDDDWGGNHYNRSDDDDDYYDSGEGDEVGVIPALIVIGLIVALVVWGVMPSKKKRGGKGGGKKGGGKTKFVDVGDRSTPDSELRPVAEYAAIDPDFDIADLREKASNLYVRMQNGWTKKDISDLRPYFTDALFTQFERQLAQKKAQGVTNYVERISVQNVAVRGFRQANGVDHMILKVEARIVDYTLNDATGDLVSGSKDREKFMTYEWDMSRTTGIKTLKKDGVGRVFCPSCGAPLDINVSARCEYCDSVIESAEHDWAICRITGLSQKTL